MNVWHGDDFMLVHDESFDAEMGPYGTINIERHSWKYENTVKR